jgi:hypothetical protein
MARRANVRIATKLAPIVLRPVFGWVEAQTISTTGHYDGWPSGAHRGADTLAFDGRLRTGGADVAFAVSKNGFGWRRTFTDEKETFVSWAAVTAWCLAPGTLTFRAEQHPVRGVSDLTPEALATIVDGYFKQYAPEAEWSAPEWQCTPAALNGPHPANMSKVRELLEAVSSRQP